jgi:hypothetical protein
MEAAIDEARAADEARYGELLRDVRATRPSGLREYYRDAQTAPRRASSKREEELRAHFMRKDLIGTKLVKRFLKFTNWQ